MSIINASAFETVEALNAEILAAADSHDMILLLVNERPLVIVPAEFAKEKLAEKIVSRFAEQPSILSELQSRLESEQAEDWN